MLSPQHWFTALAQSALGHYMQTSQWAFAITEMVHLLALAALGGSVLFIDLRLLGVVLKKESAAGISRDLGRILLVSLTVMIVSGIGLLSEEAMKCYFSPAFRWKMALLAASVVFYFTLHRRAVQLAATGAADLWQRTIAVISLTLWLGVGVAGRAIGLV
ncbi:hypothetical protein SAMN05421819_2452 [Bryocella elongata]|uniref:DUF6644 domain-containing protein n=1 Tax=Bryocella elongata TaxID=863522 RepID=A0A1H5Z3V6_9BACT|nr:DUF6644 family protein [Bryocella elongata]SEG31249.1 hypothetical protein SAMN05421819_2452 [Bryocella elongata]